MFENLSLLIPQFLELFFVERNLELVQHFPEFFLGNNSIPIAVKSQESFRQVLVLFPSFSFDDLVCLLGAKVIHILCFIEAEEGNQYTCWQIGYKYLDEDYFPFFKLFKIQIKTATKTRVATEINTAGFQTFRECTVQKKTVLLHSIDSTKL